MEQMGRNVTMQKWGFLANSRYLLHDRDTKFCLSFRQLIEAGRVKTMPLPTRSPNLNACAERWVRSVKQECLSKLILFGERPLRRALQQYVAHYHEERNHQGKQNRLLFPLPNRGASGDNGIVRCKERLGGLLKYYESGMSLRSGKLPFLGSEDEFFYHTGSAVESRTGSQSRVVS
jgi:putative transposase